MNITEKKIPLWLRKRLDAMAEQRCIQPRTPVRKNSGSFRRSRKYILTCLALLGWVLLVWVGGDTPEFGGTLGDAVLVDGLEMLPVLPDRSAVWEMSGCGKRVTEPVWISRHGITQWQWEQVMGTRPWQGRAGAIEGPERFAYNLDRDEIHAFCARLSEVTGALWHLPTKKQYRQFKREDTEPGFRVLRQGSIVSGCNLFRFSPTPDLREWYAGEAGTHGFGYSHPPLSRAHDGLVSAMAVSPDGTYLATADWNSIMKLWSVGTGEKLAECRLSGIVWHAIALAPGGRYAAFGDAFKMLYQLGTNEKGLDLVHVWDIEESTLALEIPMRYRAFAFSPDGRFFAVLDETALHLFDTERWEAHHRLAVRQTSMAVFSRPEVGFNPDSDEVTVLDMGLRATFRVADGAVLLQDEFPERCAPAHTVVNPVAPYLVACCEHRNAGLWQVDSSQMHLFPQGPPFAQGPLLFTQDGHHLIMGHQGGWIDILRVPLLTRLKRIPINAEGMAALPSGTHLIVHDEHHVFMFPIEGPPRIRYFRDNAEMMDLFHKLWNDEDDEKSNKKNETKPLQYGHTVATADIFRGGIAFSV